MRIARRARASTERRRSAMTSPMSAARPVTPRPLAAPVPGRRRLDVRARCAIRQRSPRWPTLLVAGRDRARDALRPRRTFARATSWAARRCACCWAQCLDIDPRAVDIVRGRRGRPELSAAHTQRPRLQRLAYARRRRSSASRTAERIGVDIEHGERALNVEGVARKFMTRARAGARSRRSTPTRAGARSCCCGPARKR